MVPTHEETLDIADHEELGGVMDVMRLGLRLFGGRQSKLGLWFLQFRHLVLYLSLIRFSCLV